MHLSAGTTTSARGGPQASWPPTRTNLMTYEPPNSDLDLDPYRSVVSDLTREVDARVGPGGRADVEALLTEWIRRPQLHAVLACSPDGKDAAIAKLLEEVRDYRPNDRSSASDVSTLVRIYLLSQIDSIWWAGGTSFASDDDVLRSRELVTLESLRSRHLLEFSYRLQPKGLAGRSRDWAMRRGMPRRQPHTAGVSFTNACPEPVGLLEQLGIGLCNKA